jgi:ABC-type polysaccharide/polyol phosphate export permease
MKSNPVSQWAGYLTSVSVVVAFILAFMFPQKKSPPEWLEIPSTLACLSAVCCAMVCLVSALFGFLRK